jgi:hypothetical protein
MNVIANISPNFIQIFHLAYLVLFTYYGWVLFIWGFIYMMWFLYLEEIQAQFGASVDWVFLQIKVPRANMISTLAVENIFAQMHTLHRSLTRYEKFVEGQTQLWYSLELVSFGGKVSFILRVPRKNQHAVESAFYAQYPEAEIVEIEDYMKNFEYDPQKPGDYDIFGTEFKMRDDQVIPIKTYKDFEHTTAEEAVIDPLANIFITLERILPHEFVGIQMLIQPIQDDEWKAKAEHKILELTGAEVPHKLSFVDFFMAPFNWFAKLSYKEALLAHKHAEHDENRPRNNWLNMTESEKERVTMIEKKLHKAAYQTKIRHIYIAPKDQYDKGRRFEVIGAYRHFGSGLHNTLKSDQRIWTKVDPYFSPGLEAPILEWKTNSRKREFIKGYKKRSIHIGAGKFILNIEEIATLYHFPITTKTTTVSSAIDRTESKKSQPPVDLPIADVAI